MGGQGVAGKMRAEIKRLGVTARSRALYSQLLQHFKFTLHLRGSVGIVAKSVNENLWGHERRHWSGSLTPTDSDTHGMGLPALPVPTPGYAGDTAAVPHTPAAG